jgi:hypothetical protein
VLTVHQVYSTSKYLALQTAAHVLSGFVIRTQKAFNNIASLSSVSRWNPKPPAPISVHILSHATYAI